MEVPVTARDGADGIDELARLGTLHEVPGGAGGQSLADRLRVAVHRQHDHPQVRFARAQRPEQRDGVALGERQVEQQDVGPLANDEVDRRRVVGGLADDLEPRLALEDEAQTLADEVVVVDERDADDAGDTGRRAARAAESRRSGPSIVRWLAVVVELRRRAVGGGSTGQARSPRPACPSPRRDRTSTVDAVDARALLHAVETETAPRARLVEADAVVADHQPDACRRRRVPPIQIVSRAAMPRGVADRLLDDPVDVDLQLGFEQAGWQRRPDRSCSSTGTPADPGEVARGRLRGPSRAPGWAAAWPRPGASPRAPTMRARARGGRPLDHRPRRRRASGRASSGVGSVEREDRRRSASGRRRRGARAPGSARSSSCAVTSRSLAWRYSFA